MFQWKKVIIASMAAAVMGLGANSAYAYKSCTDSKNICTNGELYGALLIESPANSDSGYSKNYMAAQGELQIKTMSAEKDGWKASTVVDLNIKEAPGGAITLDELYAKIAHSSGMFLRTGIMKIGDVETGNSYVPEVGNSNYGDYGNMQGDAGYLTGGYSADGLNVELGLGLYDKSFEEANPSGVAAYETAVAAAYEAAGMSADDAADAAETAAEAFGGTHFGIMNVDLAVKYEMDALYVGFEYEMQSYSELQDLPAGIDLPDSKSSMGLAFGYSISGFTPFLNYGSDVVNADTTNTQMNIGLDMDLGVVGLTVGMENDKEGDADAVTQTYLSVEKSLGEAVARFSYWMDGTENASVASQIGIEIGTYF
ncbi:MAG: hypothetical protein HQM12_11415 [SAR324 cluster bacterium]|nr:hypothetical protein [SAR324 cluster bacterium]